MHTRQLMITSQVRPTRFGNISFLPKLVSMKKDRKSKRVGEMNLRQRRLQFEFFLFEITKLRASFTGTFFKFTDKFSFWLNPGNRFPSFCVCTPKQKA